MSICHPEADWSCKYDDDTLADMRADPEEALKLERAEAFAWSLLASLTAYGIGTCPITVRPCAAGCLPTGGYVTAPVGGGSYPLPTATIGRHSPFISGGVWYNACGCSPSDCSCTQISEVLLPGPVGRIESVVIDGVPLSRSAYRVDSGNRLVRTDGEAWPACQDMGADEGEGTFLVSYYRGAAPNLMVRAAAGALAVEFLAACAGEECRLPWNLRSRTVQGDTYEFGDEGGAEGVADAIPEVAAVVRIYNPHGLKSRPRIVSPDARKARVSTWT